MDGGIAALLGAIVGVSGTVGSAWLGYQASRRQITDGAALSHATRLREERREAYLSYISTTEQLELLLRQFNPVNYASLQDVPKAGSGGFDWELISRVSRELQNVQHAMFQAVSRVDLAGPHPVAKRSGNAWLNLLAVRDLMDSVASSGELTERQLTQLKVEISAFHDEHELFMRNAEKALQKLIFDESENA
ncbi:hypothetical protein ACFC18_48085 [Streptomyces sp. NPDC056121]|uniref:hypothetical protein n=1 Tax=Streptomyces sp. NPDC056121 TaxID=3345718 RepID=UPI0035DBE043